MPSHQSGLLSKYRAEVYIFNATSMNLLVNPLADVQKVWNNVKGAKEPRHATNKATDKENDIAVFSFITPSIIGNQNYLYPPLHNFFNFFPYVSICRFPSFSSSPGEIQ